MGVIAPEGAVNWVDRELDILPTRPQDPFAIGPEQVRELRQEIFPYWRGKTLEDSVASRVPEEIQAAVVGKAFSLNRRITRRATFCRRCPLAASRRERTAC